MRTHYSTMEISACHNLKYKYSHIVISYQGKEVYGVCLNTGIFIKFRI